MSSEVFESREDELRASIDGVNRRHLPQIEKSFGEEKKRNIREAERAVEDANILVQEMEQEAKKAPTPYRTQMNSKLRNYRRELERISSHLRRAKTDSTARDTLLFGQNDDFESMASSQRARMMQGTEILTRTSESINRSQMVAAETDMIGHEIIDDLGTQREALVRTRDRLQETDENLSKSRKILNSMGRRVITNKLIMGFIIFLEVAILGGVTYWKFFS